MSKQPKTIAFVLYLAVLIASHMFQSVSSGLNDRLLPGSDRTSVQIPNRDLDGSIIEGELLSVVYEQWGAWNNDDPDANTPVLLMHGAPGMGTDFARLGGFLTANNRAVYAPDMVGFAMSDMGDNVSYRVQAKYMFSFLDAMGVDRVHLVGWSNGGGVGIRMADLDPDRVASLTMLASVGAQETEGSGSYFFEHVKYAVGLGVAGFVPDLIPHFGLLGTRDLRIGWLWSFWDSDQRELTRIMPTIETPVMILHGRHDPLVHAHGAEIHHEMMPSSKLVMLDASHFLPFMQADETAGYLNAFFDRHDKPGIAPETGYLDLSPIPERAGFDGLVHQLGDWVLRVPWWAQLLLIIVLVRYFQTLGLAIVMLLTAMSSVDFGVAILGMLLGRGWWLALGAHRIDRPFTVLGWVRSIAYVIPVFVVGLIVGIRTISLIESFGLGGAMIGFGVLLGLLAGMRLIVTWEGRQRLKGEWARLTNHEYWMTGFVYLPMLWWGLMRMIRRRWLVELTSVNPGYAHDGGIMCESKMDINRKLGDGTVDDAAVLHCVLIEESQNPQSRIDLAIASLRDDPGLGGYPVFCKPDQGERGRAVEMVHDEQELIEYCTGNTEPFVIQQRHSGEMEVGVMWVRHTESVTDPNYAGPSGFIYAITIKHFPFIVGDGKRTVRRLILGHKRYRAQSRMFLTRMSDRLFDVPALGEELTLGVAGNHAQGTMFVDGTELITDELSDRIGQIVDRFVDEQGNGFDIGRFDLRCDSLDGLARGEGFGIVELNGLTSEPTNLYDPKRSIFWAWDMLCGYWKHAEKLGAARIETQTGEMVDEETWKKIRGALVRVMFT